MKPIRLLQVLVLCGSFIGFEGCATSQKTQSAKAAAPYAGAPDSSSTTGANHSQLQGNPHFSRPDEWVGPSQSFGPPEPPGSSFVGPTLPEGSSQTPSLSPSASPSLSPSSSPSASASASPSVSVSPPPSPDPSYGPNPVQVRPITLVLGPGLARGFAYAGIFQALKNARIPIGAVLGTEMGGLMGILYAMSANPNQFEWGLLKLTENVFLEKTSIFSKLSTSPSKGELLENRLNQILNGRDLSQSRIPIRIAIQAQDTGIPVIVDRGSASQAARVAMGNSRLFSPVKWEQNGEAFLAGAANSTRPFLVREGRQFGGGPVVVVNVLGDSESRMSADELKEADLVIRPKILDIAYLDFSKKSEAAYRGKNAVLDNLHDLQRLVGEVK